MSESDVRGEIERIIKDRWPDVDRRRREEMAEAIARELAQELERDDGDYY